jgi:hypothetical protein
MTITAAASIFHQLAKSGHFMFIGEMRLGLRVRPTTCA